MYGQQRHESDTYTTYINPITKCKYFNKDDSSFIRSHMAAFDIWLNTKQREGITYVLRDI